MIIDAQDIPPDTNLSCDSCVVGTGAAGITLALELAKSGQDVILLEAGNKKWKADNQELYKGNNLNPNMHAPLENYRHRRLGGTTTVWGGRCIPFDAIDFEHRSYVPHSSWPISRKDLDPYYRSAHDYCDCGNYAYRVHEALPGSPAEMVKGFKDGEVISSILERFSQPTNFGTRYFTELKESKRIRLFLNANCTNIRLFSDGHRVSNLQVTSLRKNFFTVKGQTFILAAGGLEITRLLLASNQHHKNGIGNHSGWLGRCYMSHISGNICQVKFSGNPNDLIFGYEIGPDGVYCRRRFWISENTQRKAEILNFVAMLDNPPMQDPRHQNGVLSLAFFAKHLQAIRRRIPPEYSKQLAMGSLPVDLYWRHLRNIVRDLPRIGSFFPWFVYKRFLVERIMPSLIMKNRSNIYSLHYHAEQAPNFESRVTLSQDRDPLGTPRLQVDFRVLPLDVESIYKAHLLIAAQLRETQSGELIFTAPDVLENIENQIGVGGHHIGTTRMAREASGGVVDENCQVHGVQNLYVASSSVFPTSSQANPTLTIVAIAIRLAEFITRHSTRN